MKTPEQDPWNTLPDHDRKPRQGFTKGELCLLIVVALGFLAAVIFGCISIATRMLDLAP